MVLAKGLEEHVGVTFIESGGTSDSTELPYVATLPINRQELLQRLKVNAYASSNPRRKQRRILTTGTERVNYIGNNYGESGNNSSKYIVAVYDKETQMIKFEPAEYFVFQNSIKATGDQAVLSGESLVVPKRTRDQHARQLLSETFGTKKAKLQMLSSQRNQVNMESLSSISHDIQNAIDKRAENMHTMKELEQSITINRHIPPFDAETSDVSKIYKINDLISENELELVSSSKWMHIDLEEWDKIKVKNRLQLPVYVADKMDQELRKHPRDTRRIGYIIYLSYMFRFYEIKRYEFTDPETLERLLGDVPKLIVDSLLNNFTEVLLDTLHQDIKSSTMTTMTKDRLISYILTICLILDNFVLDYDKLAKDLKLPISKVQLYLRALGCTLEGKKISQRDIDVNQESSPIVAAKRVRLARLMAPLSFPKQQKRRRPD